MGYRPRFPRTIYLCHNKDIFTEYHSYGRRSSLELKLVNSDIEQVDSQKLLEVTIDKHLSFDVHVEEPCKKLSQGIAVLRKIRDSSLLNSVYFTTML